MLDKKIDKKRAIGDVAKDLGVETHVIRFWESKFPQIKPEIGKGSRRYYFEKDVAILTKIKTLLHDEGYTIAGLQKLLKKRKKDGKKEADLDFLIESDNLTQVSLSEENKSEINLLIKRIENNLNRFEDLLSDI